ncbi:lipopolysaccharide kinase InaA family protein [Stutzerimonas chloritidismutans]|uniref:lipopolysaccharide kinase InaA family protein n=1 Tax=Stutzerimonas chloritidismutans TaxID=203192 RepID=UPI00384BC9CD
MRIVTAQELESWMASGEVLERDARGPKVVALDSETYLKIFYTRRHPLLARMSPYAEKFARNVELLNDKNIPTPKVIETFWLSKRTGLTGCTYRPLPGESLEQMLGKSPEALYTLIPKLAKFIKLLHEEGIYFRSLHLGNIILTPNGELGLIDVLDLKKNKKQLSRRLVKRNFKHLQAYTIRKKISCFPLQELIKAYESI